MSFLDDREIAAPLAPGEPVRIPSWPGFFGVVVGLLSLLIAIVGKGDVALLGAGYVLGAVAAPALAVAHRYFAEARRKDPWFVGSSRPGRVIALGVGVGLAAGLANAWLLATELAKR
jgi:hypothetical protein